MSTLHVIHAAPFIYQAAFGAVLLACTGMGFLLIGVAQAWNAKTEIVVNPSHWER